MAFTCRLRLLGLVLIALLALPGCERQDRVDHSLAYYHRHLAELFRQPDPGTKALPEALPYPALKTLRLPVSEARISLLDFLQLSRCELQRLVGERNSSLGKLMAPSQQLYYDLRFLALGEQCLITLQQHSDDVELMAILKQSLHSKRSELRRRLWNATFASPEFKQLFTPALPYLLDFHRSPAKLLTDLQTLYQHGQTVVDLQGGKLEPGRALGDFHLSDFERALGTVGGERYLGRLLRSQTVTAQRLTAINGHMAQWLQLAPPCSEAGATPDRQELVEFFRRKYLSIVQYSLSKHYQRQQALSPLVERLLSLMPDPPPAFQGYWSQSWQTPGAAVQKAFQDHARLWQQALKHCQLQPGDIPRL